MKSVRDAWPTRNHPSAERRSHPFIRERIEEVRLLKRLAESAELRRQLGEAWAERDTLAMALAETRDHARVHGYAALATAPTTDLAAQREARIRADERVVQLGIVRAAIASYRAAILIARRDKTVTIDTISLLQAQDLAATQLWEQISLLQARDLTATQLWEQIERLMETR